MNIMWTSLFTDLSLISWVVCFFWCGVNNKNNITSDHLIPRWNFHENYLSKYLGRLGWHVPQRQLYVTYCSPQLRSWKALPKKEDLQAGSIRNEISINQAEKIQECMSLSNHHLVLTQCYLQLVPLELFVGASHRFICRLKLRTWYVLRWSQMPRIGLMGAATFHWFDVACDRNARRKCSFATFRCWRVWLMMLME